MRASARTERESGPEPSSTITISKRSRGQRLAAEGVQQGGDAPGPVARGHDDAHVGRVRGVLLGWRRHAHRAAMSVAAWAPGRVVRP